jgi:hypothetical protein
LRSTLTIQINSPGGICKDRNIGDERARDRDFAMS